MRFVQFIAEWIDRWVPDRVLAEPRSAMRGRAVVGASMFAASVSLVVQALRLSQEGQHWIPLASWTLCTLSFILIPIMMRWTGRLGFAGVLVAIGILVGSLGVAVKEGGINSPNSMLMIVAPVVASLLGGWRSGAVIALVVAACGAGLFFLHDGGLIEAQGEIDPRTGMIMRCIMAGALACALYALTLFYDWERSRQERDLADAVEEVAHAQQALIDASAMRLELVEAQQRALEQDMELTAAVQRLLLPKRDVVSSDYVSVAGVNVPASQAGGDWWLAEPLPKGSMRLVVGDATGHGAAPAMITAVVAGAYRALQEVERRDAEDLLEVLHWTLADFGASQYTMPLGFLDVSPTGQAHWFSAAAPPLLLLRKQGDLQVVTESGTPLGAASRRLGKRTLQLEVGDRLLVATDGVLELRTDAGRELGLKRLAKLFQQLGDRPVEQLRDALLEELTRVRGEAPQDDDLTFAVVQLTSRVNAKLVV